MPLVKHPEHGARSVSDAEVPALVAAGWTKWPRTKEEKVGIGAVAPVAPVAQLPEPEVPALLKRGPGRPRKA